MIQFDSYFWIGLKPPTSKDSRYWMWDDHSPKKTRLLTLAQRDRSYSNPMYNSGQIIATSHDLTPNGGLVRDIPLFQGNLG